MPKDRLGRDRPGPAAGERRGAGDAARALLRPDLRLRDHAGDRAHRRRTPPGPASPRGCSCSGVLWWAWAAYAWLTNTINPEEGAVRLVMFGAMGAMLVASLRRARRLRRRRASSSPARTRSSGSRTSCSTPSPAGATATCSRRSLGWRRDRDRRRAPFRRRGTRRHGAGQRSGRSRSTFDLLGAYVGGGRGWRLSAGHFAERHALIVIIALGESIVALGLGGDDGSERRRDRRGAARLRRSPAAMWWLYFDVVAIVAERKLRETTGKRTADDGARLVQLPASADGRRDHPLRRRRQEDARRRRRAAEARSGGRALRRGRPVPGRARPLPAAERAAR